MDGRTRDSIAAITAFLERIAVATERTANAVENLATKRRKGPDLSNEQAADLATWHKKQSPDCAETCALMVDLDSNVTCTVCGPMGALKALLTAVELGKEDG